ncbi:MAG: hypothetical protein ACT4NV_13630 [Rhodoferax sp.]
MYVSAFFRDLLSSYQAEIDDLSFDSEGKHMFAKRRKERAKELDFLLQLIDTNPEMLAALFHGAFQFKQMGALAQLAGNEPEDLPEWDQLRAVAVLQADVKALADKVLAHPRGAWLLSVAAVLEFLHAKGLRGAASHGDDGQDQDEDADDSPAEEGADDDGVRTSDDASDSPQDGGNDWLADQGFERKDNE